MAGTHASEGNRTPVSSPRLLRQDLDREVLHLASNHPPVVANGEKRTNGEALELGAAVFRPRKVIRLFRPLKRTALLARQPCARQFFAMADYYTRLAESLVKRKGQVIAVDFDGPLHLEPQTLTAVSDDDAVAKARELLHKHNIELWDGERLVMCFRARGK
jgi:hypothetical protein